ncbi:MAG: metal ABC transporter permease [Actinomycetota bacterium]
MSGYEWEVVAVGAMVAAACALPGTFLVLRKLSMMSDAITHTVLLGIVIGFFAVGSLSSPLLIAGATAVGLLTVYMVDLLKRSRRVAEDAAIGLVFPLLFSVAVILISRYAGDVHLDVDAVLLGEIALAPQDRLVASGFDLGPRSLWMMGAIATGGAAFVATFFKELKLMTFDAGLAEALGFRPAALNLALMALVSVTAVGAFDAVGSILVVALMIGPPAAALLLTNRLGVMMALAVGIGVASAPIGYLGARRLDASIAGAMAATIGVAFVSSFLFAPNRGLVAIARRHARQRWEFAQQMLAAHLFNHDGTPEQETESHVGHIEKVLGWPPQFRSQVIGRAVQRGLLSESSGYLTLTDRGREFARKVLVH